MGKQIGERPLSPAERTARWRQRHPERLAALNEAQRPNRLRWAKNDYASNREHHNAVRAAYRKKVRATVLAKYGGACRCCGETEPCFLGVDHIHGDGKADRKEKGLGYGFYLWLYKMDADHGRYQLLCHNCNFAKGHYGDCPHQKARLAESA